MMRHALLLLGMFVDRSSNALLWELSPVRTRTAIFFLACLLFAPLGLFGLILVDDGIPQDKVRIYVYGCLAFLSVLPVILCYLLPRRKRRREFVHDLWQTSLSGREVAFAICYWPVLITFLAMLSVLCVSPLLAIAVSKTLSLKSVALMISSIFPAPLVVLSITLLPSLDLARNGALWMRSVVFALGLGIVGCGLIYLGCWLVLRGAYALSWSYMDQGTRLLASQSMGLMAQYLALPFVLGGTLRSLFRYAGVRVFASVESAEAGRLLSEYQDFTTPRPALAWGPRLAMKSLVGFALFLCFSLLLGVLLHWGVGHVVWTADKKMFLLAIASIFAMIVCMLMEASPADDQRLIVVRPFLIYSVLIKKLPYLVAVWTPLAMVAPYLIWTTPMMGASAKATMASGVVGPVMLALVSVACVAVMLTPKRRRGIRATLIATYVLFTSASVILDGNSAGQSYPPVVHTIIDALAAAFIFFLLGWVMIRGYRSTLDRLLDEAIVQERSR